MDQSDYLIIRERHEGKKLIQCDARTEGELIIPYGITEIGNEAFQYCSKITSIRIPNSVTVIGLYAFDGCRRLTSIVIPSSVTEINSLAFEGCSGIMNYYVEESNPKYSSIDGVLYSKDKTILVRVPVKKSSINIPSSVTEIGWGAFNGCSYIKSVELPSRVTIINGSAFSGCSSLESIKLPNSVTRIEWDAFLGCTSLTSVVIPSSVTEINPGAFDECSGIMNYYVDEGNLKYSSIDGVLYSKDKTVLVRVPAKKGSINIPSSVTKIGWAAFKGCRNLNSIKLPSNVTKIFGCSFSGCSSLASIKIPNSVTEIGNSAFECCTNLKSIELPPSMTMIESSVFSGCTSLTSIEIPSDVTKIGFCAFKDCTCLISIEIPSSVTEIGRSAFEGCSNLKSIELPNSLTMIDSDVFSGCNLTSIEIPSGVINMYGVCCGLKGIKKIIVDNNNPCYCAINDVLYSKDKTEILRVSQNINTFIIPNGVIWIADNSFSDCTCLTSVEIPSSVTVIGESAFRGCSNLSSIEIPDSVTTIGDFAFEGCTNLISIAIPSSVTKIGKSAFEGCKGIIRFIVDNENSYYSAINGALYSKDNKKLIRVPCGMEKICIPSSLETISFDAFSGCSRIKKIEVDKSNCSFCVIDGLFFTQNMQILIRVPCDIESVTIPQSVCRIGPDAFYGCQNITEIHLRHKIPWDFHWVHHEIVEYDLVEGEYTTTKYHHDIAESFSNLDLSKITLYVPIGTGYEYRHDPFYSKFKKVVIEE